MVKQEQETSKGSGRGHLLSVLFVLCVAFSLAAGAFAWVQQLSVPKILGDVSYENRGWAPFHWAKRDVQVFWLDLPIEAVQAKIDAHYVDKGKWGFDAEIDDPLGAEKTPFVRISALRGHLDVEGHGDRTPKNECTLFVDYSYRMSYQERVKLWLNDPDF